ncbi:CAAX prenyl protease-related protein [Desulfonatronovibrio hydrogenovorans]|uniref:CAAX prenyl protease-related protein n=1 Tax=Desulfonatronovibrio hydrogenovorans TaxID=53245 RepID=UPI00049033F9|nr:CAAX prenyl protease-related protein [Desulfonatronovibrio hydrogenovorans]
MFKYIAPFALFAVLTYLPEVTGLSQAVAYPVKTILVGALIIILWKTFRPEIRPFWDWTAVAAGVAVFLLWIGLDGLYPQLGTPKGFDPYTLSETDFETYILIAFRMAGAVLVVPVMEEIFWRSFALRVLIDSDFKKIPLGQYSFFSFIAVSIAFGFVHHQWLPGIIAGMIYAGVLYRTGNLFSPIISHAVTNLLLGLYVLWSQEWFYW